MGRPDLLVSVGKTANELGHLLFASIQNKILTLPDATRVFPAHGAGSACGKNLSTETSSTLGEQRATNYALQFTNADAFVAAVTEGRSVAKELTFRCWERKVVACNLLEAGVEGQVVRDRIAAREGGRI